MCRLTSNAIKWSSLIIFVLLLTVIYNCGKKDDDTRINIVVTIPPQAEFVRAVGGDKVSVSVLVPPGANPHTYEPTPAQLKSISEADIYYIVGSGIEFELTWVKKLKGINHDMVVIDGSEGIELIDGDPHIWLSPKNAIIMVNNLCEGLIKIDPDNSKYYEANKDRYIVRLRNLDNEIMEKLSGINNRRFIVYHPSWAYFCHDYNLTQIPIEQEGKDPTAQTIEEVIKEARSFGIDVVFVSPQHSTRSAEVIADEIGGETVPINPLSENYIENIKNVADKLAEALKR